MLLYIIKYYYCDQERSLRLFSISLLFESFSLLFSLPILMDFQYGMFNVLIVIKQVTETISYCHLLHF